jgi:ABC transporter ATM
MLRARVVLALGLLVGAKVLNIQVPFLFKRLADELEAGQLPGTAGGAGGGGGGGGDAVAPPARRRTLEEAWVAIPLAVLLSYGLARSTSGLFTELRNALFATVAQRAIRVVSRDVFRHLLRLDQQYHLSRPTGTMQRVMDRGSRSINFVLTALVFNVVPTALEAALVLQLLGRRYGTAFLAAAGLCVVSFVTWSLWVVENRVKMLQELNDNDNAIFTRFFVFLN